MSHRGIQAMAIVLASAVGCAPASGAGDDGSPAGASAAGAPPSSPRRASPSPTEVAPLRSSRAQLVSEHGASKPWVWLDGPLSAALPADGSGVLHVRVVRNDYRGSIKLTVSGLPTDVSSRIAWIAPGANEAALEISATCNLLVTTATVHLEATGGGLDIHDEAPFELVVGKQERRFGSLDVRLGGRGYVPLAGEYPGSLVPTQGGRALLLTSTCELARYDVATASLDASFGANGIVSLDLGGPCEGLRRAPDGMLVASAIVEHERRVVRVLEGGAVDPTYDARLGLVDEWAFDATGRMLGASSDALLRRRDATGAPDPTFTPTPLPRYPAKIAAVEDGAIVVGSEAYLIDPDWPDISYRLVASHVGLSGGIDSELLLPTYVGNPWNPQAATWALALPSGDVLLAVAAYDSDSWTTAGALIRLERPSSAGGAWQAKLLTAGTAMGTPSFDADGSIFIGTYTGQHNGPGWGGLIHIDASEHVVATGAVGPSDPWYPWAAMGRLVPVGDGTALVATSNPRGDWGSNAVLARVWIRP